MAINIGSQIGSHEITGLLGKGGMGEVYRARDSKLKREVAIKILPEEFSRDADRVSRFQREAEVLASLNHPNIATIYDLVEANGARFLVLELVEGETLADRIRRGPIPFEEAVSIAKSICEALEAAHGKGIVHRDLKPANVKITPDGKVKVLDFGLAKIVEGRAVSPQSMSHSPTLNVEQTLEGVILGTAGYMSPEQIKGRSVDKQADVWAFGCVLYEMLTAHQAFEGDSIPEIVASILRGEPDWAALPGPSQRLKPLLGRCLAKKQSERIHEMADVRLRLLDALRPGSDTAEVDVSTLAALKRRERAAWLIAGLLAIGLVALGVTVLRPKPVAELSTMRFTIPEPTEINFGGAVVAPFPSVSPDGQRIVFVAQAKGDNTGALWVRSLDKIKVEKLPGTENALLPFWSSDSRSVGFFADRKLKKIDVLGGPPVTIADVGGPGIGEGGAWNASGVILFGTNTALMQVAAGGGTPTPVKTVAQASHRWPSFLPDGRHYLFLVGPPPWTVHVGSLDSTETKQLFRSDSKVLYTEPGYLLFIRTGVLMAQGFDARGLELTGDPFPIAQDIASNANGRSAFSVSNNGTLVYRNGAQVSGLQAQLVWFDRSGKEIATLPFSPNDYRGIELSPDGDQLAVHTHADPGGDIWILNLKRGTSMRLTFDVQKHSADPHWSPDGTRLIYKTDTPQAMYIKSATGSGAEERLFEWSPVIQSLLSTQSALGNMSRDGSIIFANGKMETGIDLWVMPTTGDRKPFPYFEGPNNQVMPQFSPDGKWVAYMSNESGTAEIYIRPFPSATSGVWQASNKGGLQPRWRSDGKELFFLTVDFKVMAVDVKTSGTALELGVPHELFASRIRDATPAYYSYDVSRDGKQFIMATRPAIQTPSEPLPLTVVLNWPSSVRKSQ